MRILYIGGFELPDKNAAAHRVVSNAKALRESGHEVSFIGVTKHSDYLGVVEGFGYCANPYPESLKGWIRFTFSNVSISDIKQISPDVIIAYNYPGLSLLGLVRYCKREGIRLLCDITEWYDVRGYGIRALVHKFDSYLRMNVLNKRVDGIIAISTLLCNSYKKYADCAIVPPLVDLSDKKFDRNREILPHKGIRLIYAGSPSATKDHVDEIVKAVGEYANIEFVVVGLTEDQYKGIYGQKKRSEHIPPNVKFLGRVSHSESLKMIQNSDFQIFYRENSRVNNAGFPTKFVESVSCGIPVITTLTSDIGCYLEDGVNGFVISSQRDIRGTLQHVASLQPEEVVQIKKRCLQIGAFDYHEYIEPLDQIVGKS